VEEIPGEEMLVGKYDSPDSHKENYPELTITVTDPNGDQVLQQSAQTAGLPIPPFDFNCDMQICYRAVCFYEHRSWRAPDLHQSQN
jgi:hypothetical protein